MSTNCIGWLRSVWWNALLASFSITISYVTTKYMISQSDSYWNGQKKSFILPGQLIRCLRSVAYCPFLHHLPSPFHPFNDAFDLSKHFLIAFESSQNETEWGDVTNWDGASVAASIGTVENAPIEAATDAPPRFVTSPHALLYTPAWNNHLNWSPLHPSAPLPILMMIVRPLTIIMMTAHR